MSDNLWPNDFGEIAERTPVAILREQAKALGERTNNIVVGRVESVGEKQLNFFQHELSFYCSPLSYHWPFLHVVHDINLYPVDIVLEDEAENAGQSIRAKSAEEFMAHLREIFSREKTKKIIASLIAQSKQ